MPGRLRIDRLLVERGLVESRERASRRILAGEVLVDGQRIDKVGALVAPTAFIELVGRSPYVSRGGDKLAHALAHFTVTVAGQMCLDVGASTGGFTDCLLQNGAARVYAVDVGAAQLDARLRADERVVVMENTNARTLDPRVFADQPSLAAIDVAFISLEKVLPAVFNVLAPSVKSSRSSSRSSRSGERRWEREALSVIPSSTGPWWGGSRATRFSAAGTSSA